MTEYHKVEFQTASEVNCTVNTKKFVRLPVYLEKLLEMTCTCTYIKENKLGSHYD